MATASDRRRGDEKLLPVLLTALVAVWARGADAAEPFRFTPGIGVRETLTDNVDLSPNDSRHGDFVTEILPSVRMTANGARLKLTLNYQLDALIFARDSSRNDVHHLLDANATLEAIERFAFVDLKGNISQAVISPFGPRPPSDANFTTNRTESRSFEVSPYVRGSFLRSVDYELRYRYTDSRTTDADVGRSQVDEFSGRLTSQTSERIGWSADALSQTVHSAGLLPAHVDSATGHVTYTYDPSLRFTTDLGVERQDVVNLQRATNAVYGGGVEWRPTPRTNAVARWDHQYFGSAWSYGISHRFPRLAFNFSDTREVTSNAQQLVGISQGAAFDLLFNALASRIPDPAERTLEAQRLLQQGGIPADLNVPLSFASSGVFISRRQQFGIAAYGPRNTLTMNIYRNRRQDLNQPVGIVDVTGTATAVTDTGADLALSHRLTPLSALAATLTWQRTAAGDASGLATRLWQARLIYTMQLRRDTSVSLEARHSQSDSDVQTSQYRENALVGSLNVSF